MDHSQPNSPQPLTGGPWPNHLWEPILSTRLIWSSVKLFLINLLSFCQQFQINKLGRCYQRRLRICSSTRSKTLIGPMLGPFSLPNASVPSLSLRLRPFNGYIKLVYGSTAMHLPWNCLSTLYFIFKLMVSSPLIRVIFISNSSPSWLLLSSPHLLDNVVCESLWHQTLELIWPYSYPKRWRIEDGSPEKLSLVWAYCDALWLVAHPSHIPAPGEEHLANPKDWYLTLMMVSHNLVFLGLLPDKCESCMMLDWFLDQEAS